MKIYKFIITTLVLFLTLPFYSNGAVINKSIGGSVNFQLSPKNPGALENVKITAISYEINLDKAYISWYLDDTLELEGPAQKVFNFFTEKNGKTSNIKFIANIDGRDVEKTMSINPGDVEIIWEADTYVPPTYKGKALASPKSALKVIAIPHFVSENGNLIPEEELVYEWSNNFEKTTSGLNKNSANITMGTPLGENTVSVIVSTQKGDITAEKQIKIKPENVFIAFYEDRPLEGTNYNSALRGTANFFEKESSVRAEPFFFSHPESERESNLAFSWTLNGKGITPNEGTPKIITLRNESGMDIISSLGLTINNITKIFQNTSTGVLINSSPGSIGF